MLRRWLAITLIAGAVSVTAPPLTVEAISGPAVTIDPASSTPLIGDALEFTVTFDNVGPDIGFGPYVDLRLPIGGADGAPNPDGIAFTSANYIGATMAPLLSVTCTGATVTHPLTRQTLACSIGTQLVVLQLPFGSFTVGQPPAPVTVRTQLSNLADMDTPLTLTATPGFAYGESPLGSPPGTIGIATNATVTPQMVRFSKTYEGPEFETATGPNYPRRFRLSLDVATDQTLSAAEIVDILPPHYAFLAVTDASPGGTQTETPAVGVPSLSPTNELRYTFPTVVGVAGEDRFVEFEYFIPRLDATFGAVLDPASGDDLLTRNDGAGDVTVVPLDPRDAPFSASINPNIVGSDDEEMTAKSIAIQKSGAVSSDIGAPGLSPGDGITYTVQAQVSDYFSFGQVTVTDVLGDGQSYQPASAQISFTEGGISSGPVPLSAFATVDESQRECGDGTTKITFDVSNAYIASGGVSGAGGVLTGGRVNVEPSGPATFTITFGVTADDLYACRPGANQPLNPNDHLVNSVTVEGEVLDNSTQASQAVPGFEDDTSSTELQIVSSQISKAIYARNGVVSSSPQFTAADLITYRLQFTVPAGDTENLVLSDYLPLPALQATPPTASTCVGAAPPGLDEWCYGPAHTHLDPNVTVSSDVGANSITWDFGDFSDTTNAARVIDILFTLQISDEPFRDGLFLTNQLQATFTNSFADIITAPAIIQIELTEPRLRIRKGVVDTNSVNETFTGGTRLPTGVTFAPPATTACSSRFTGTVNSTALDNGGPDADVSGPDADDIIRFAIVVENTGSGLNGAFDVVVSDAVPVGYVVPSGGVNLCVTNGSGVALAHTATGYFTGTPDAGPDTGTIELTDPSPTSGSLAAGQPTNATGTNVAVISYDLQLETPSTTVSTTRTNTATLTRFAATEAGPDFTPVIPVADRVNTATTTTQSPSVSKTRVSTDQLHTIDANVAIGEIVDYRITVAVPEGLTPDARISDALPAGLRLVAITSMTPSSGLSFTGSDPLAAAQATATTNQGASLVMPFGDLTNSNTDDAVAETIVVDYRAVVVNIASNQATTNLANTAFFLWGASGSHSNSQTVTVREPVLDVQKSASPAQADQADVVTFTIRVSHTTGTLDAFEVSLTDKIPAGLTYVPDSLTHSAGTAPTSLTITASTDIAATWTSLGSATSTTLTYQATVDGSVTNPSTITNTAAIKWSSLPLTPADLSPFVTDGSDRERTGAGGVDDHSDSDTADVATRSATISKSLTSTSEPSTTGSTVTIGETARYTLTVGLPEGSIPNGFAVVDAVPNGMQYVAGSAVVDSSALAGTLPVPTITGGGSNGTDVTFTFGATTINADNNTTNNSFTVQLTLRVLDVPGNVGFPPGQVTLSNGSSVRLVGATAVDSNTVATPVVEPRLQIVKTFNPTTASQGDEVAVNLAVTNTGLSTSFDTIISDTLDAHFVADTTAFVSAPAGFTPSRNGAVVTYTGGDIAAGATVNFQFTVSLVESLAAGTLVPNVATATQATTLPGAVAGERDQPDTSGSANLNVVGPDLVLTKTDGVTSIAVGTNPMYTLTVQNVGGFVATGVTITDTLPPGMTFVSVGGAGCSATGTGPVVITLADPIPAGGTAVCTITLAMVTPVAAGVTSFTNSATAADDGVNGPDPTPGNNTSVDTNTLTGRAPDVAVTKSNGVTTAAPGQTLTYSVVVTNPGNIGVSNVLVTDTLPTGVDYVSCTPVSGAVAIACAESGGVVTTTFSTLAGAGGSASFTINVIVDNPLASSIDTITNSVTVTDDGANGADTNPGNNTATDIDTVDAAPDMVIVKSAAVATATVDDDIDYTLAVANTGDQDATGVVVTDTLPAGLVVDCLSVLPTPTACTATTITWGPALGSTGPVGLAQVFQAGTSRDLTYTATVTNPAPAGTTGFVNTATVADDGDNGVDVTPTNNTDTAEVDLTGVAPDLVITKTDGETVVSPSDELTYVITVTNNGTIGATGVEITDVLPAELVFVSCTDTCDTSALPTVTWTLPGELVGGGGTDSVSMVARVRNPAPAGSTSVVNPAAVTDDGTNGLDADTDDNTTSDTNTLTAVPDLDVIKNDGVQVRTPGESFTYNLMFRNKGDQTATGVVLIDTLPATLQFDACPAVSTFSGSVTCSQSGQTLTWFIGTMPGGATLGSPPAFSSVTAQVEVTVVGVIPDGVDSIVNTVTVADDGSNGVDPTDDNSDTDTDTLVGVPAMSISKTNGVTTVAPGDTLTYTIVVANEGSQTATGVEVIDTLPAEVDLVSCTPSCDSSSVPTMTWTDLQEDTAGSISDPAGFDPGGTATLMVVVTVRDPQASGVTSITNTVTVTDDGLNGQDPDLNDNEASDTDTVSAAPDLSITKTDGRDRLEGGDTTTYTIAVTNVGNQDADGVVVTDVLPAGVTFGSCNSSCDTTAPPTVTWNLGTVAGGDTVVLTVTVTVDDVAEGTRQFVNTVSVEDDGANGPDPTPDNNTAVDINTFGVDLAVTKSDGQNVAVPGQSVTYTIVVTNNGPSPVTSFQVVDTLPASLLGVTYTPSSGSYASDTGTWSGFGSFDEGELLTLTVTGTIDPSATGDLVNSVTVTPPAGYTDPTLANNVATDTDILQPSAELTIVKTHQGPLVNNELATYTITVTNVGPSTATDVVVTDQLPESLTLVAIGDPDWVCVVATCTLDQPLQPGKTATLELVVRVAAVGSTVTNVVFVSSATPARPGGSSGGVVSGSDSGPITSNTLPATGAQLRDNLVVAAILSMLGLLALFGASRRRPLRR